MTQKTLFEVAVEAIRFDRKLVLLIITNFQEQ